MYPETLILWGTALGLAVATVITWASRSGWWGRRWAVWSLRWATRPWRVRRTRRTTREALAYAERVPR